AATGDDGSGETSGEGLSPNRPQTCGGTSANLSQILALCYNGLVGHNRPGTAMESRDSRIPALRADGYLPEGSYRASVAEVTFRFGASTSRRRRLALRLRRWI